MRYNLCLCLHLPRANLTDIYLQAVEERLVGGEGFHKKIAMPMLLQVSTLVNLDSNQKLSGDSRATQGTSRAARSSSIEMG